MFNTKFDELSKRIDKTDEELKRLTNTFYHYSDNGLKEKIIKAMPEMKMSLEDSIFKDINRVTSLIFKDDKGLYRIDTRISEEDVTNACKTLMASDKDKKPFYIITSIATKYVEKNDIFSSLNRDRWLNGYFYDNNVISYAINRICITDRLVNAITIPDFKNVDQQGMIDLTGVSRTLNSLHNEQNV